jgi:NitT/TauT family transport system substrate-binding protein
MQRQRFLAALAAASAATPAAVRAASPIVVNITASADLLPFHYAYQQGLFTKAGLDVTWQPVPTGALVMVAIVGNAAQIGFGGLLSILTAYSKGVPVQLIAPGAEYLSAAPQTEMFVRPDAALRSAKDLEGQSVAVPGLHDQSAIGVRAYVDAGGGDSTLVKFVEMPPNSMLPALDAKRVDAIVLFEPLRSEALARGARSLGKPFDAISRRFLSGAYFATRSWLADNRDAALRFAAVLRQGAEYANAHYDELIPVISGFSKVSPEVVRRATQLHYATALAPSDIQPLIDVAVRYKEFPAPFRAQDTILPGSATR